MKLHADDPMLVRIRVGDVAAFLRANGWRVDTRGAELVFEGPNDDSGTPITLAITQRADTKTFRREVADLVNTLSVVLDVDARMVVRQVRERKRDILAVKVEGGAADYGALGLDNALELIAAQRDLIVYAACAESEPNRSYFARALKAGTEHASRCLFGQTFEGSFGVTIESPLTVSKSMLEAVVPPKERLVVERIMRGLDTLNNTATTGDDSALENGFAKGLNANMCEALLTAGEKLSGCPVTYSVAWSPELMPTADVAKVAPVRIGEPELRYLETAARALRKNFTRSTETLRGKVTKLHAETQPNLFDTNRLVTIFTAIDNQAVHVQVKLGPEDYQRACDAHRDGADVTVKGVLEKEGKLWHLRSPSEFQSTATPAPAFAISTPNKRPPKRK